MAALNLSLLESELRAFRRQKRLQYPTSFPVGWQPLVKDASLAEGAHMTLLGESASDIEWQQKVLEYQRAPFWRQWYRRLFTSQVAQLELYFYARFTLFLTLLRQTSSPSLFRARQQHLLYYLSVAQRTLPRLSPLVRAVKRSFAPAPQRIPGQSRFRPPSTPSQYPQGASYPTASEKLGLDAEYHYTYLWRQLLQPAFTSQRRAQPAPIQAASPASPSITEDIAHHYQHMKLAFRIAILSETDVFRRRAWISRQRHAIRSLRQRAKARGLRLPKNLPASGSAFQWPSPPPASSFAQRLRTFLPACHQRLLTLYQRIRAYSSASTPANPSPGAGHPRLEPELKQGRPPARKAQESGQELPQPSPEQTHSLSEEFDQCFRQLLNRLIASPAPNFDIINAYNQVRIRTMQRIRGQFSLSRQTYAERLDSYQQLQQRNQRFQKLAKQYPPLIPFTTSHLEGWLRIHQQRLAEIKDYQTLYAQWLEIKHPTGFTPFSTFHVIPPQSLQEELWKSLTQFYRALRNACRSYVIQSRRVKKQARDESAFLLLQKGFYTLRQLAREWCHHIPATKITLFNQQLVRWEADILNSLPRLIEIKTDSEERKEFKTSSTPAPAIPLPEDAYIEFHRPPFRQPLEYRFVCGLFAMDPGEKDPKLIHTQLADGVEALSSALQPRPAAPTPSSDGKGKALTRLAEYAAHAEYQLRHPLPALDVPDQQKIRWQRAQEYIETHGRALRQQWLEVHPEEKEKKEEAQQTDNTITFSPDSPEQSPKAKNHDEIPESKSLPLSQESLASSPLPSTPAQTALQPTTALEVLTTQVFPQLRQDLIAWKYEKNLEEATALQQRFQEFCSACRQLIDSSEHLMERLQRVELFTGLQMQLLDNLDKGHSLLLETFINGANIFDDPVFTPAPARAAREDTSNQQVLTDVEWAAVFSINLEKLLDKSQEQPTLSQQLHVSLMKLRRAVHFDKYADSRNSLAKESSLLSHLPPPSEKESDQSPLHKSLKNQSDKKMHLIHQGAEIVKDFPHRYRQLPLYEPPMSKEEWDCEYAEALARGFQRKIKILFLYPRLVLQHLRSIQHPEFIPPSTRLTFPSRKTESEKSRQGIDQWILDFKKEFDERFEKEEKEAAERSKQRQEQMAEIDERMAEDSRQHQERMAEDSRQHQKQMAEIAEHRRQHQERMVEIDEQSRQHQERMAENSRQYQAQMAEIDEQSRQHPAQMAEDSRQHQKQMPEIAEQSRQHQERIQLMRQMMLTLSRRSTILPFIPSAAPSSSASSSSSMSSSTTSSSSESTTGTTSSNSSISEIKLEAAELDKQFQEQLERLRQMMSSPSRSTIPPSIPSTGPQVPLPSDRTTALESPDVRFFTSLTPGPASASSQTPSPDPGSSSSSSSSIYSSTTSPSSDSTTGTASSNSSISKT